MNPNSGTLLNKERKTLLNEAESVAHMGSWKWTAGNDELIWSDGLHSIFNKGAQEIISWNTFLENVLPEDVLLIENCLLQVKTNRNGSTVNYRILNGDKIRYLTLTIKPHSSSLGDILGSVVDITERKEIEIKLEKLNVEQSKIIAELDEKEKKYRSLFERSIDPIFLATQKLDIIDSNNSFNTLFGNETNNLERLTIKSLFSRPQDYRYFLNTIKTKEQIRDFEVLLLTKNGSAKICTVNCVFIPDQSNDFCCYQGIIKDLSLRKQAEVDMILAERLSLTGKIVRTIAHEVRNPLTNLSLALDQLKGEFSSENESAKLYSSIIERNANRIEQLVGEMLNSSRPKQLNLRLTEVKELINDTLKQADDRLQLNDISIEVSFQKELPRILIDKEKIQIALLNIVINAIEATEPGKGKVKIAATVNEQILTVAITDNGKGIPDNNINKLFDPFFTGKKKGMGLGLTTTKNVLNSHSASVEVASVVGEGTTFFIHFKLAETFIAPV
jgi:PAS domain S-box-containing protein